MEKTRIPRWNVARPVSTRILRIRIIGIILFIWLIHQQHLFSTYQNALSAKYAPTDFRGINLEKAYQLDDRAFVLQAELLARRPSWKKLGAGCEGTTYTFNDNVIKTFTPGRSPFRNCAPRYAGSRWPAEIPASIMFGNGNKDVNNTSLLHQSARKIRFLPVKAAFYATVRPGAAPEWHLVTPLARNGTLQSFSKKLRTQKLGFSVVDTRYRDNFHDLLQSLQGLHNAGFCHDDIKPDNIFIGEEGEWILGDLGNLRQISHPYHESRLWSDNQQLRDCRANDILRALKTYILFLRSASFDVGTLDEELLLRRGPLSEIFWWTMDNAQTMTGDRLRQRSSSETTLFSTRTNEHHEKAGSSEFNGVLPVFPLKKLRASRRVKKMLSLGNSDFHARRQAMTWIFGIQQDACTGV
jgi:serine/threonine protein kinase